MYDDIDTQRRIVSWRDVLPIHPAAELFPRMSEAEIAALADDIKANGLKSPIVLWAPSSPDDEPEPLRSVLDGINRLDAMERADLQLVTDPFEPTDPFTDLFYACTKTKYASDCDPYAYVISANLHRRHLTAEQKRELIGKLLKAQPEKSDRTIAQHAKVDHKTVAAVRAEKEGRGEIPHAATRADSQGRQQPARKPPTKAADSTATQRAPIANKRDDIGSASSGEVERLKAQIEELRQQLALRDQRIAALEREVAENQRRIHD